MKKIILAVALVGSTSVFAQNSGFKPGFYMGLDAGYSKISNKSAEAKAVLESAGSTAVTVSQNTNIGMGRIFAGYKVTENFDFEVGYYKSVAIKQNFSGTSSGSVDYEGKSVTKPSGFDYSVLIRPSVSTGLNNAFLSLGGHYATLKSSASLDGTQVKSLKTSGGGYLFGLGYDVNLTKNIDARIKVTRLNHVGGDSGNNQTVYGLGLLGKF